MKFHNHYNNIYVLLPSVYYITENVDMTYLASISALRHFSNDLKGRKTMLIFYDAR